MTRLASHDIRALLWIAAGAVACLVLTFPLVLAFSYTQAPSSYARRDLLRQEAFSPLLPLDRRHVIIGSCEVSLPIVGNDFDQPGAPQRSTRTAWLGNVASFVLHGEYSGGERDAFFDISAPNTVMAHHTVQLYYAARVPNLSSIIYVNGLGLGHDLSEDDTLELVGALELMERELPQAAPQIRAYRDLQTAREAFRSAERRHPDWRAAMNPQTLTLDADWADTLARHEDSPPPTADLRSKVQFYLAAMKTTAVRLLGGPATAVRVALEPTGFDARRRAAEIRTELEWSDRMARRPDHHGAVTPLKGATYLDNDRSEFHRRWFDLLDAVAKARNARLVIYAQPMLAVRPDEHRSEFVPHYMERIAEWLVASRPVMIDHTVAHDLDQADFALSCPPDKPNCGTGEYVATGYHANLMGRHKQARLLVEALRTQGVLAQLQPRPAQPGRTAPATQRPRCIEYLGADGTRPGSCETW